MQEQYTDFPNKNMYSYLCFETSLISNNVILRCDKDFYCYTRHSEEPAQRGKVITSRSNYLVLVIVVYGCDRKIYLILTK